MCRAPTVGIVLRVGVAGGQGEARRWRLQAGRATDGAIQLINLIPENLARVRLCASIAAVITRPVKAWCSKANFLPSCFLGFLIQLRDILWGPRSLPESRVRGPRLGIHLYR